MASRNQWERWNNDGHSSKWRERHVNENGGHFIKTPKGWDWVAPAPKSKVKTTAVSSASKTKKSRKTK